VANSLQATGGHVGRRLGW